MTAVAVLPEMTVAGAERLSTRISGRLDAIADNYVAVMPLIREAINRNVHAVLGYASPGAYVKDRFGDALSKLGMDVRREVVRELSNAGLSTRAIAPVVGVSHKTVVQDKQVVPRVPPAPTTPVAPAMVATASPVAVELVVNPTTGELIETGDTVTPGGTPPRPVTGLDGKTYTAQSPRRAPRKPLTDVSKDAGWDLRKASERIARLTEDDRFARNKEEVAAHIRGHLMFTVEVCQDLLDVLNQERN